MTRLKILPKYIFFIALLISGTLLYLIGVKQREISDYKPNVLDGISHLVPYRMINILYWNPMFSSKEFYFGTGSKIFEQCSYKNCYATYIREYLPVEEFDAILFHGHQYQQKIHGKPSKRNEGQVYVYATLEPPTMTPDYRYYNFFNWTMTYRSDSDIVRSYGVLVKKRTGYEPPSVEDIKKRPKFAAWMVSRCHSPGRRENIVAKLKKMIPVDVYGACGDFTCPRNLTNNVCDKMVEDNYKFYLSFENSVCDEYATEKVFAMLNYSVVPVVYGGANYKNILPHKSVINVKDFESLEGLVEYLKYLDTHPEEYLKYFEWKKDYLIEIGHQAALCQLCKKLNEPIKPKTYGDVVEWWRGKRSERCTKWESFIGLG